MLSFLCCGAILCLAQIKPTIIDAGAPFEECRPGPKTGPRKRPLYRTKDSTLAGDISGASNLLEVNLGVTLWRLRPSTANGSGTRMLVHEQGSSNNMQVIPERITSEAAVSEGEHVRLSIESTRRGYLYVVDREEYADGSLGDPYIIFPTTRTHGGDNELRPGRLIEIPARDDDPNYFTMKKGRPDQTGEALFLIQSPRPLPGINPGLDPIKLSTEEFQGWEKKWGAKSERFEMEGGAGRAWTEPEKAAGSGGADSRALSGDDPLPETIYRAPAKPGDTVMVRVPLTISK
ncbi:MAG TPA: hypothetical protein VI756_25250 [Blastocatellia bacterium]